MDARIIVATSRNLKEEVRRGRFREDLYYRLRTVPLFLPPLLERPEDIPALVNHFISRLNRKYRKDVRGLDPKIMGLFQHYHWPGNVRELERVLEYAFVFVKGPIIHQSHLPELDEPPREPQPATVSRAYAELWEDEREAILKALKKAQGRRQVAARLLGISRSSLWRKMRAHCLS
jgi:transcriptional regulator with PAS, ATPase and Fis domain